jgi:hypothetical protein
VFTNRSERKERNAERDTGFLGDLRVWLKRENKVVQVSFLREQYVESRVLNRILNLFHLHSTPRDKTFWLELKEKIRVEQERRRSLEGFTAEIAFL